LNYFDWVVKTQQKQSSGSSYNTCIIKLHKSLQVPPGKWI